MMETREEAKKNDETERRRQNGRYARSCEMTWADRAATLEESVRTRVGADPSSWRTPWDRAPRATHRALYFQLLELHLDGALRLQFAKSDREGFFGILGACVSPDGRVWLDASHVPTLTYALGDKHATDRLGRVWRLAGLYETGVDADGVLRIEYNAGRRAMDVARYERALLMRKGRRARTPPA